MKNLMTKIARGIALVSLTAVVAGGAAGAPQAEAATQAGMAQAQYAGAPSAELMADLAAKAVATRALNASENAKAEIAGVADAREQASNSAGTLAGELAANEAAVNVAGYNVAKCSWGSAAPWSARLAAK